MTNYPRPDFQGSEHVNDRVFPVPSGCAQSPRVIPPHSAIPFPNMEPTITYPTSPGNSTNALTQQGQELHDNAAAKRSPKRRQARCPVCFKIYARTDSLKVRSSIKC